VKLLVDSGAVYSVLPERTWRALGLKPKRTVEFDLADGTSIERKVGEATFIIGGVDAVSPVVLGTREDSALLGAVTLESLGLMLNPLSRELLPMHLVLGRLRT
jgi:predicted aspartyl protease